MIVIANPGNHPELIHLAAERNKHQRDVVFWTAGMLGHDELAARIARRLPPNRMSALFSQRVLPESLGSRRVRRSGLMWEIARITSPGIVSAGELLQRRNNRFARRVAKQASSLNPGDILIAQQTAADAIFRAGHHAFKVLNYPIAHHRWSEQYLASEAETNPKWRSALQGFGQSREELDKLDAEVDMADAVLVASSFSRRTFIESGVSSDKLITTPLGVDYDFWSSGTSNSDKKRTSEGPLRVLFPGQLTQRKGLSYLLSAATLMDTGSLDLVCAGPGSQSVTKEVHANGARTTGPVDRETLRSLYNWADLVVLPSLVEGFGLTALEAMAAGTATLVSTHTFGPDLMVHGENGFVVSPGSTEELLECFQEARRNPALLREMGARGAASAEAQSWGRFGTSAWLEIDAAWRRENLRRSRQ